MFRLKLQALQDQFFPNSLFRHFMFQLPVNLHTNGSGDFTLLSAKHWNAVGGYPEIAGFCMHTDAVLCYTAHHNGAREHLLNDPMRIYHIEHGTGSGDGAGAARTSILAESSSEESENSSEAEAVSAPDVIPHISLNQFFDWALEMRRKGGPILFNTDNWGLGDESLPETVMRGREEATDRLT